MFDPREKSIQNVFMVLVVEAFENAEQYLGCSGRPVELCNFQCRGKVGRVPDVLAASVVIVQVILIFLSLSPFLKEAVKYRL